MQSRGGLRSRAVIAALAVLAVVFAAFASGSSHVKPYTASFSPGPVPGGSSVVIDLVLTNLSSQQTLGSATVTAAKLGSTSFQLTGATDTSGVGTIDTSGFPTLLKLRNLGIAPREVRTFTITVTTPCLNGDYVWEIRAKQSNNFSGPPGNDFSFQAEGSNLVTTVEGGCKLEWVTQPATTSVNKVITGSPYDESASKVAVKAVDALGNTLTSLNSGTVTLTKTAGTFTSTGGFTGTQATFVAGIATFTDLKSSATGTGFKLQASSPGLDPSPESSAFDITLSGTLCTTEGCVTEPVIVGDTFAQAQTSSSDFVFIGIGTLDTECTGFPTFQSVGATPIVVTDMRTSLTGDLYVTYGIKKKLIEKKYGRHQGQQFIPICAGSKRIRLNAAGTTEAVACNAGYVDAAGNSHAQAGWWGKTLDAEGKFDESQLTQAKCDAVSGFFIGILGSFQDYTNSNPALIIDANTSPTVVEWWSDTEFRYFRTRFPSSSGAGVFADVPWDGWKGG